MGSGNRHGGQQDALHGFASTTSPVLLVGAKEGSTPHPFAATDTSQLDRIEGTLKELVDALIAAKVIQALTEDDEPAEEEPASDGHSEAA
jgi:hypothetical protein